MEFDQKMGGSTNIHCAIFTPPHMQTCPTIFLVYDSYHFIEGVNVLSVALNPSVVVALNSPNSSIFILGVTNNR